MMSSRSRWRSGIGRGSEDAGSMVMLMMVMIVGLMLSALLVPMIITQDRTTRFDTTRVQALDAAQSGIDVILGLIRSATSVAVGDTHYYGDSSKLPCGPVSGSVSNTSAAAYSVVIEYFTFNPVSEPAYPNSTKAMKCVNGYGTFDPASGTTTPKYARLTSTGTVGAAVNGSTGGRTIVANYLFRTSNVNLLGGEIQMGNAPSPVCLDAGSTTPPAGTPVVLQPCSTSTPPAAQQVFAYRSDLTLQLTSSATLANVNGLCLTPLSKPAAYADAVQLAQCGPLGAPLQYTQQWSYNDDGKYQAAEADSVATGNLPDLCMSAPSVAAGQSVILTNCGAAPGFTPSASVGAGAAALPPVDQLQRIRPVPGRHRPEPERVLHDRLPLQAEPVPRGGCVEPEVCDTNASARAVQCHRSGDDGLRWNHLLPDHPRERQLRRDSDLHGQSTAELDDLQR